MPSLGQSQPLSVLEQMLAAMNRHDLEAFVALFAPDYDSQQPAHPERPFTGRDQVRKNWAQIFGGVADFRADMLGHTAVGDDVWVEWRWYGSHRDGSPFEMRGMTIFTVRDGQIVHGRLYMEPVQRAAGNIDSAVKEVTTSPDRRA